MGKISNNFKKFFKVNRSFFILFLGLIIINLALLYIVIFAIVSEPRPDNEVFHKSVWSFESRMGIKIPDEIKKNDIQCYGHNNWMGDGVVECSFVTNEDEIKRMLLDKPNGGNWIQGPYHQETCIFGDDCDYINRYMGVNEDIKLLNGENIFYSFKTRSEDNNRPYANFDLYVVDVDTNTVMIKEYNS